MFRNQMVLRPAAWPILSAREIESSSWWHRLTTRNALRFDDPANGTSINHGQHYLQQNRCQEPGRPLELAMESRQDRAMASLLQPSLSPCNSPKRPISNPALS